MLKRRFGNSIEMSSEPCKEKQNGNNQVTIQTEKLAILLH